MRGSDMLGVFPWVFSTSCSFKELASIKVGATLKSITAIHKKESAASIPLPQLNWQDFTCKLIYPPVN